MVFFKFSDLKNAFDKKYLNIKLLLGYIEMKPMYILQMYANCLKIDLYKKSRNCFGYPFFPYFTIEVNLVLGEENKIGLELV